MKKVVLLIPEYGSAYRVVDGVLMYCAVLDNGKLDSDNFEEVDLGEASADCLKQVNNLFGTKFN